MRFASALAILALIPVIPAFTKEPKTPPPSRPLILEGTIDVEEKSGEDRSRRAYRASLCLLPGEGGRWVALRLVEPASDGGETFAAVDALEGKLAAGAPLPGLAEEPPMELEESRRALEGLLPLDAMRPEARPAAGEERTDLETVVLGLAAVRLPVVTSAQGSGERMRIASRLAPGARPEFRYNDGKGVVTDWSRAHDLDPTGTPEAIEDSAAVEIEEEDSRLGAARRSALKAVDPGVPAADAAALVRDVEEIGKLFDGRRPSKEIAPRIEKLAAGKGGRAAKLAGKVLSARLEAYRTLFEKDEDGRKLAALLGGAAPDFTLEALDGKKVAFRELTRGKAVLLSFWGYG